ncbi:MAG: hypothetical protein IK114_08980 [Fibrobacter sp.]|nr:hypothetical protein [Fibrobacter sp.]
MAFKSVGQKYGFVSAGDVFRKRLADARAETQQKVAEARAEAEQKVAAVQQETEADTVAAMRKKGLSDQLIAEIQSEVEALRQSRLSK